MPALSAIKINLRKVVPLLWISSLSLLLYAASANAGIVSANTDTAWPTDVAGHIRVLKNVSDTVSPAQIASTLTDSHDQDDLASTLRLAPARPDSANWLELTLANKAPLPLALRLVAGASHASRLQFLVNRHGAWMPAPALSDSTIPQERTRFPTLPLTLDPGQQARVLIRVENQAPVQMHPTLYSEAAYQANETRCALYNGLLFGGLLMLGWGALLLAVFAKNGLAAILGALCLALFMYHVSIQGYGALYMWPLAGNWNLRSACVFGHASLALLILFVWTLARRQKIAVPAQNWLRGLLVLEVAMFFIALAGGLSVARWVGPYSAMVVGILLFAIAMKLFKQQVPTRKLVLVTAGVILANLSMLSMGQLGLLPHAILHFGIANMGSAPYAALASLTTYAALLTAWIHQLIKQQKSDSDTLAAWQAVERRRLKEEVARQTDSLTQALQYATEKNRQKTEAINFISHDLRAPLATIIGYTQLLKKNPTQEQSVHIHAIERSANFQLSLINDLLTYTKNEALPQKLAPALVRIADLMDDICQYATGLCVQQHNQFEYEAASELPPTVLIDSRSLRQILLNLLSNAAKFTRGGVIRLTVKATQKSDEWLLYFEVSDSGIGIDANQQSRIFGAFEQVKSQRNSSGLGLFIAQRTVERLGGVLHVESAPTQGSKFSFQVRTHSMNSRTIHLPPNIEPANPELESLASSGYPIPPAPSRIALAQMARDGHLSDIESWLAHMTKKYPECHHFFESIQKALDSLNLEYIEALALSKNS